MKRPRPVAAAVRRRMFLLREANPPPHVGGYGAYELSGLEFFQYTELRAAGAGVVRDFRVAWPNGLALHPAHLWRARAAEFRHVGCSFERVVARHLAAEFLHEAIFKAVERNDCEAASAFEGRAGCRQCP